MPVIAGSLGAQGLELHLLGLASPSGCFELGVGSSLWECADCGTAIRDREFLYSEDMTSPVMRAYHAAVEEALSKHRALSDEESSALTGHGLIRGFCRRHFEGGADEVRFEPTREGFVVRAISKAEVITESHATLNNERWGHLERFRQDLSDHAEVRDRTGRPVIRLRVSKQDQY
ncbi:MAG: hypothetical protein ACREHD_25745, partial [Pirellulales bacterium]